MSNNHVTGVNTQATGESPEQPKTQAPEQPKPVPANDPVVEKIVSSGPLSKEAGLDIGTMFLVASRLNGDNVVTKKIRDVFIDLDADQIRMLKLSGNTSYVEKDGTFYVLGDDAQDIVNILPGVKKLRAPMEKGVISAGELEAMEMLKVMVGDVLGQSPEDGICTVSSPSSPIDNDFDALYHQAVITDIVESYGWEVQTSSESTAMAYSECADSMFTGLCISFGHGMTNVSLVFKTIEALKFSVSRGGSWIDENAAKVTNKSCSQICAIKEKGINILNPQGREQSAIAVYYKHLIKYVIHHFIQKFKELSGNVELPEEIPCVVAGGTSIPQGFIEVMKQEINKNQGFPFPISEVRQSSDPLNSISRGLLIMSQNYQK